LKSLLLFAQQATCMADPRMPPTPRAGCVVVPQAYRGRYSYRQEQRTPDTPNLASIQLGYRVPGSAWDIVVDRSGSISTMSKPLQQGLMAIHLALEELALPHRIAAFEGNALLKDFGGTSPVPRALIARRRAPPALRLCLPWSLCSRR